MTIHSQKKIRININTTQGKPTKTTQITTGPSLLSSVLWKVIYVMLRSQIKLTSYDFSDLHITGEVDNRPGTGHFLRIFFCVVTYRKGAGRRLYMKTSADAWPGTVRRRTGRRCKRSTGHRTVPGRFYTNFHEQWWIYVYQNSSLYLQRNSLLK